MYRLSRFASESALKYFLVQALASATLLLFIILTSAWYHTNWFSPQLIKCYPLYIITSALILKAGIAPFHFWLPVVAEGLAWTALIILLTWQKVAPFILILYLAKPNIFIVTIILLSVLVGALGGVNQTSLRKILAYSSINHIGWIISALLIRETLWITYFIIYALLSIAVVSLFREFNLSYLSQLFGGGNLRRRLKLLVFSSLLSIGGLPPFLGFLPKWITIQAIVEAELTGVVIWIVFISLVTLYFYTRVAYAAIIITHSELKWFNLSPLKISSIPAALVITSVLGLPLCSLTLIIN